MSLVDKLLGRDETRYLTMDKPHPDSLLDTGAQGVIGKPVDRVEGPLKVSGRATYAAEYPAERLSYGVLVRAPFGSGMIREIATDAARSVAGVIDIVTAPSATFAAPGWRPDPTETEYARV